MKGKAVETVLFIFQSQKYDGHFCSEDAVDSRRTQNTGKDFRHSRMFVLDTGSGILLIRPGVYSSEVKSTNLSPFGVAGKELEIHGIQEVTFHLNGRKFSHQFCVCSLPTDADGIIGMDILAEKNADLNLEK